MTICQTDFKYTDKLNLIGFESKQQLFFQDNINTLTN